MINEMHADIAERRVGWFRDARFGMFIHYGLYSVAGRHEWVQNRESISAEKYRQYFEHFHADRFDPRAWVAIAKAAGMRYIVLTSKHHEGFCLWGSEFTDFSAPNAPAGRDLVAEFAEACREQNIKFGLYYSLIDWHHEDFPIDGLHPEWERRERHPTRGGRAYVQYLHAQVMELLDRYEPDILWFDFSYPGDLLVPGGKGEDYWQSKELIGKIRSKAPNVLLNDRLDIPGSEDFITPEEVQPSREVVQGGAALWEACRTLNGSWGYAPAYQNWMDAGQIVRLLVDSVSKGGNLLLNVGPTARGDVEERAADLLYSIGKWIEFHGESVHGAGPSSFSPPQGCRLTQNGDRIFLHVFEWPSGHLVLDGLPRPLKFARFVHDGVEVRYAVVGSAPQPVPHAVAAGGPGTTVLTLPLVRPDVEVPVIELHLGSPEKIQGG